MDGQYRFILLTLMRRLIEIAQRLLSISDIGLQYAATDFERDRHTEIRKLGLELLATGSGHTLEALEEAVPLEGSYPTPKVDVRAVVFDEAGRLLYVREKVDGKWALPGGWAEIGLTPAEVAVKECQEEAGLTVEHDAIWMVVDKKGWGHPVPLHATYKIFIHCRYGGGEPQAGYEVHDAAFFGPEEIPELSVERITRAQIETLYRRRNDPGMAVVYN